MNDKHQITKAKGVVPKTPERLPMDTLETARRSLARVIKAFYTGALEEGRYRGTVYGMQALLQYFKLKYDEEEVSKINKRLDALEQQLAKGQKDVIVEPWKTRQSLPKEKKNEQA